MTEKQADQICRCVKECWWRALLVVAIPIFLVLSLQQGWPVIVTLEDGMAAWVQAIGSVVAIVGAYFISRFSAGLAQRQQLEKEERERKRIENGYKEVARILYTQAKTVIETIENAEELSVLKARWDEYAKASIMASLKAFNDIPLYDIGSAERVRDATLLEMDVRLIVKLVTDAISENYNEERFNELRFQRCPNLKAGIRETIENFYSTYQ